MNKQNLKIYKAGLLVVNGKESYDYDFSKSALSLCLKNYSKAAASLEYEKEISYLSLMRMVKNNLPVDFFKKFDNIQEIFTRKVKDQN